MKFSFSVLYSGDIPLVNICLSVEARIIWMVVEKAVASHEHHGADAEHNLSHEWCIIQNSVQSYSFLSL